MIRQLLGPTLGAYEVKVKHKIFNEIKINDGNDVLIYDDPISGIGVEIFYLFKRNKKIYWMLELYEHQLELNSPYRLLRYLFFKILGSIVITLCDELVVSSKLRLEYIRKTHYLLSLNKKIKIVKNIPELIQSEVLNEILEEKIKNIKSKTTALAIYAGSMQEGRYITKIIDGFANQAKYGLVLCGAIKNKKLLDSVMASESVLYLGNLKYEQLLQVYKHCDIGLLSYANTPLNTKLCAPVKIWEYLRASLIVLGNNNYALLNEWAEYISSFYDDEENICSVIDVALEKNMKKINKEFIFDLDSFK